MYTYTHLKYLLGYLPLAFVTTVRLTLLYIVYDGIIFFFNMYSKKRCNVLSQDQQFVKKKNNNYFLNFCTYLIEKC